MERTSSSLALPDEEGASNAKSFDAAAAAMEGGSDAEGAGKDLIHITHVFSSFSVKNTSDTFAEMQLVQESWQSAADLAIKSRSIRVEFIDAVLPMDDASVPSWARRANLQRYLVDVVKGRIATVGEPYEIGVRLGRGRILVVTNADIGAMEDFYIRVWDWATKDYRLLGPQVDAISATASYLHACLVYEGEDVSMHRALCREDAKVVFANNGGLPALWEEAKEAVGLSALQKLLVLAKDGDVSVAQAKTFLEYFVKDPALFLRGDWKTKLRAYRPLCNDRTDLKLPLFAGTVTRLDTPLPIKGEPLGQLLRRIGGLPGFRALARKSGEKHPGNDCFVISRALVPRSLQLMSQPQGVRPFGFWVVFALKHTGVPFRRVSSTREQPWTFHTGIGLWGGANIPWLDRANAQPKFTLFLSSNWDRISGGLFRAQYTEAPAICRSSTWPWRNNKFCSSVPHHFCNGFMRYACADYLHLGLRDSLWYFQSCSKLFAVSKAVREPICSFCNFFFEHQKHGSALAQSKSKLDCLSGELPYCDNLSAACSAASSS